MLRPDGGKAPNTVKGASEQKWRSENPLLYINTGEVSRVIKKLRSEGSALNGKTEKLVRWKEKVD